MSTEKRICTHPKRESRRSRARLLQERMLIETNEGNGPAQRAYARGYTQMARWERALLQAAR